MFHEASEERGAEDWASLNSLSKCQLRRCAQQLCSANGNGNGTKLVDMLAEGKARSGKHTPLRTSPIQAKVQIVQGKKSRHTFCRDGRLKKGKKGKKQPSSSTSASFQGRNTWTDAPSRTPRSQKVDPVSRDREMALSFHRIIALSYYRVK